MRKAILGAASALALASPAVAADLSVQPRYSEVPSYEREVHPYEYRRAPRVVIEEPAPVVSETVVVRRPVIVAPPPVVVDEYPVYAAPRVYAAPPVYAYAGPVWRDGWGDVTSAAVGKSGISSTRLRPPEGSGSPRFIISGASAARLGTDRVDQQSSNPTDQPLQVSNSLFQFFHSAIFQTVSNHGRNLSVPNRRTF